MQNQKIMLTSLLVILFIVLITVNSGILINALHNQWTYASTAPGTDKNKLASDFSSFYNAAYALIHNPSYTYDSGQFPVPQAQDFRYSPWFLVFILPLIPLGFVDAQTVFTIAQFCLLPIMALLI